MSKVRQSTTKESIERMAKEQGSPVVVDWVTYEQQKEPVVEKAMTPDDEADAILELIAQQDEDDFFIDVIQHSR